MQHMVFVIVPKW